MKLIFLLLILLLPGLALAHIGPHDPVQHAGEHLLLATVVVPFAWLLLRWLGKRKS
ncbi:MAG: hypothetical protein PVG66_02530 [Chromatiales bacterium]